MQRGRPSKREYILQASRQVFSAYGYQGTTIDLILQTANVSKPTIYNNFSSKLSLWSALIDDLSTEVERALQQRCELCTTPSNWTSLIIHLYKDSTSKPEYATLYRVAFGESYKMDSAILNKLHLYTQLPMMTFNTWMSTHKLSLSSKQHRLLESLCSHHLITQPLIQQNHLQDNELESILATTIDLS